MLLWDLRGVESGRPYVNVNSQGVYEGSNSSTSRMNQPHLLRISLSNEAVKSLMCQ